MSRVDLSVGKLGRQTLIYGLAFVLGRAASFLMLPVYTRYLTPADYGVLQLVQMTVEVAGILLAAGTSNGVLRFYFKAEGPENKRRVFASAFYLLQAFNALTAGALALGAGPISEWVLDGPKSVPLVYIAAGSVLFEAWSLIPLLLVQAKQQATLFTVASAARLTLQIGLNLLFLVVLERGVAGVLTSTLLTNLIIGGALSTWMLRQTGFAPARDAMADLLRFGIPYRFTAMGTFVLTFGDRYFLKAYQGLSVTGLYALAYQFGFLLMWSATLPFLRAWNPQRFELAKAPPAERDARYNEGLRYFSLLIVTIAAGIGVFVRPVLVLMADPAYHDAALVVPLIVAAYLVQSWTDVVELGIQISERTRYAAYATWFSVLAILALYSLLIPRFGAFGAALATLVSFTLRFFAFYLFSQKLWPVRYRWGPTLLLLVYASAVTTAAVCWRPVGLLAQFAAATLLFGVYCALAWFGGPLARDERERLVELGRERLALRRST